MKFITSVYYLLFILLNMYYSKLCTAFVVIYSFIPTLHTYYLGSKKMTFVLFLLSFMTCFLADISDVCSMRPSPPCLRDYDLYVQNAVFFGDLAR